MRTPPRLLVQMALGLPVFGCGAKSELLQPSADVSFDGPGADSTQDEGVGGGDGRRDGSPAPDSLIVGPGMLAASGSSTCTVRPSGRLYCWGGNHVGQLGDGTTTDRPLAVVVALPSRAVGVAADPIDDLAAHVCAITDIGDTYCWGNNFSGQTGAERASGDQLIPVRVSVVASIHIALGMHTTFTIDREARCWAWGLQEQGALGIGNATGADPSVPRLSPTLTNVSAITGGDHGGCAIANARAWCWGQNQRGEVGDGTTTLRRVPTMVVGLEQASSVATGSSHSCALASDHTVWCWGSNGFGQLARLPIDSTPALTPVQISGLRDVLAIAAGNHHTCAIDGSGAVWCWGDNAFGQLGHDSRIAHPGLVRVDGIPTMVIVAAGGEHSCASTELGAVWCWGSNQWGEVGPGSVGLTGIGPRVVIVPE